MTGKTIVAAAPRARDALRGVAAALLALSFATAPMPVWAASVLSDGSVSPTSGTTTTAFTFSVHYTSTDPPRPAQSVWAEVGSATVTLIKASGTALDGTWQGMSTLSAGTWQVTFHATTAGDQPQPLLGPIVTVTAPPPTPQPTPPPQPTAAPTPLPTQTPPRPRPQPTPPPTDADDRTAASSPSLSASASGSAQGRADDDPAETPASFEPATDGADTPPGARLASLLIVGGAMSLGGAAVLARQWHVRRRGGSR
jgi:hypothetical protein